MIVSANQFPITTRETKGKNSIEYRVYSIEWRKDKEGFKLQVTRCELRNKMQDVSCKCKLAGRKTVSSIEWRKEKERKEKKYRKRGQATFLLQKVASPLFILNLTGEEVINRQGGTQVILSATLSYDKRAHNGIQIIIYYLYFRFVI